MNNEFSNKSFHLPDDFKEHRARKLREKFEAAMGESPRNQSNIPVIIFVVVIVALFFMVKLIWL